MVARGWTPPKVGKVEEMAAVAAWAGVRPAEAATAIGPYGSHSAHVAKGTPVVKGVAAGEEAKWAAEEASVVRAEEAVVVEKDAP